MEMEAASPTPPAKWMVGVLLFDEFAIMDACGPMQFFDYLRDELDVVTVAASTGVKWTSPPNGGSPMHATYSFETCPALGVLLLPGGYGCRKLFNDPAHQEFILRQAKTAQYLLSVCTGAGFLAEAGLLDGKRATTNKKAFREITSTYGTEFGIEWVAHARWVEDGHVWTSSGITAGMDMTYAFLARHFGVDRMKRVLEVMEYTPTVDPSQDPFSYLTQ